MSRPLNSFRDPDDELVEATMRTLRGVAERLDAAPDVLRVAVFAMAVPHWIDLFTLRRLVGGEVPVTDGLWQQLTALSFVESFETRGEGAVNLHERYRRSFRRWLRRRDPQRLRRYSQALAGTTVETGDALAVEGLYHLLVGDPKQGDGVLSDVGREWLGAQPVEACHALSNALLELVEDDILEPAISVNAALIVTHVKSMTDGATATLELLRTLGHLPILPHSDFLAEFATLEGDVAAAEGKSAEARSEYLRAESIQRSLLLTKGATVGRWRGLAATGLRLAALDLDEGDFETSERRIFEALELIGKSLKKNPSSRATAREQATVYDFLGLLRESQGRLTDAEQHFQSSLDICLRLREADSANSQWIEEVVVAQSRVANVAELRGNTVRAVEIHEDCLRQSIELQQYASSLHWRKIESICHDRLGSVALDREDFETASSHLLTALRLDTEVSEREPTNTQWQRDVFVALGKVAKCAVATGQYVPAYSYFHAALAGLEALVVNHADTIYLDVDVGRVAHGFAEFLTISGDPVADEVLEISAEYLERALDRSSDFAAARLEYARLLVTRSRTTPENKARRVWEAVQLLEGLVALSPENAQYQREYAAALALLDNW